MELLLVTPRPEAWNECLPVFQRGGNTLQQAASLEDAAPIIRDTPPVLAILDLGIEGKALRQAVIDIMMINASVHTASCPCPLPPRPTIPNASSRPLPGSCRIAAPRSLRRHAL